MTDMPIGMRTTSCGCCTHGCVCWMHRRTTPPSQKASDLPKCAYHAEHGHPYVTSPIGIQPDPRAAAMVSEAAELLEKYGDYELGDL